MALAEILVALSVALAATALAFLRWEPAGIIRRYLVLKPLILPPVFFRTERVFQVVFLTASRVSFFASSDLFMANELFAAPDAGSINPIPGD